jgi:hypothetical protein
MGFSKVHPSIDDSIEHPLPASACTAVRPEGLPEARSLGLAPRGPTALAAAFGPELPASGLVPPLPFLPASTVCSARYLAGLLHPAADHGVRPVSGERGGLLPSFLSNGLSEERPPERGTNERCSEHRNSRGAFTLRSFPLVDSRAASPRPLPSRRQACSGASSDHPQGTSLKRSMATPPTSRPSSIDESVAAHRRCRRRVARCSHGLPTHKRTVVSACGGSWRRVAAGRTTTAHVTGTACFPADRDRRNPANRMRSMRPRTQICLPVRAEATEATTPR